MNRLSSAQMSCFKGTFQSVIYGLRCLEIRSFWSMEIRLNLFEARDD